MCMRRISICKLDLPNRSNPFEINFCECFNQIEHNQFKLVDVWVR